MDEEPEGAGEVIEEEVVVEADEVVVVVVVAVVLPGQVVREGEGADLLLTQEYVNLLFLK